MNKTLHKKDRLWEISVNGSTITIRHGQIGGKIQEISETIKVGKNIGKKNETSPEQQAVLEAESKYNKQLDKGYAPPGVSVKTDYILPMLAHKYSEFSHKIIYPAIVQPKLDGSRQTYTPGNGLYTRKGKPYKVLGHIFSALESLGLKDVHLDGELYVHNMDFQKIISAIKRDSASELTDKIEYHIYDCYFPNDSEKSFADRLSFLSKLNLSGNLVLVDSQLVNSHEEVIKYHDSCVAKGYEGAMVRNVNSIYTVDKRSYDLQKVKQFDEDEFEIVGAEQNRGTQENQCTLLCKTSKGYVFGVKPKGDEAQREWYWNNHQSLIGQLMTVRFFGYTTGDEPVPRFPIGICLRDYE